MKKFLTAATVAGLLLVPVATAAPVVAAPTQTTVSTSVHASSYAKQNALRAAKQYLRVMPFSKKGLIRQLSSKYGAGYKRADAVWAVNHLHVSWKKQAVRAAKQYLKVMPFSRAGLIRQLSSKYGAQFTHAQAVYAVNKVGL